MDTLILTGLVRLRKKPACRQPTSAFNDRQGEVPTLNSLMRFARAMAAS